MQKEASASYKVGRSAEAYHFSVSASQDFRFRLSAVFCVLEPTFACRFQFFSFSAFQLFDLADPVKSFLQKKSSTGFYWVLLRSTWFYFSSAVGKEFPKPVL